MVKISESRAARKFGIRHLLAHTTIIAILVQVALNGPKYMEPLCVVYTWVALLFFAGVFTSIRSTLLRCVTMLALLAYRFSICLSDDIFDCWIAPYLLGDAAIFGLLLSASFLGVSKIRKYM